MTMKKTLSALLFALAASAGARADVILHAFNWKYSDVTARAAAIQSAGYKIVLVAPAHKSSGSEWWSRYQPQDYRVINHSLGDKTSFQAMINALSSRGIRVYADVVLNHKANESWKRSDLNYPGNEVLSTYASNTTYWNAQKLFGNLANNYLGAGDFGQNACINNYSDVWQVQNWRLCGGGGDTGLPDLVANAWVISQQQQYLQALKNMGVKGFRIDAAKHMPNGHMNAVLTSTIKSGMHVFGEIITGGGAGELEHDRFLAPYLAGTDHGAYDFPLFATLRGAFGFNGSLSSLVDPLAYGQALQPSRAVTFTITHDIPNNAGFRWQIMDATDEKLAYAYLLGRNGGVPMVYSDNNESGDNRWVNAYDRSDLKGMIRFHNGVQGSDMQVLSHGQCHLIFRRGSLGVVGINKCGTALSVSVNMNGSATWWNTSYTDTLGSGNVLRISASPHAFNLPARSARMWLR